MEIWEKDLPGVGKKFVVETEDKEKMTVIVHDDGRRDIFKQDPNDPEEFLPTISLNDTESRQIASILGGMAYKPKALETLDMAFGDLIIEWYKVQNATKFKGKSIGELNIRQNFDITIIAVVKDGQDKLKAPGADTMIEEGDTIVISGLRSDVKEFLTNFTGA
ncbi:cation:proton antiporter regulatory subunit [Aureibacillus halotolerans]|uniref:Potassium/proton antiporter regulatory subunit (CPA2 family) n=1 Tax=Aureibacillus halotolerans TaxID=1508390 RepID=A0A4R6U7S4_9BACI|nr:cation:proton antiporter regulatory subunit [Aureibacillus halotolerans]TDQ42578.1 potassium/proton antiporter regulatory subunit (CPA2 family) [Aureibacillus halotolerans]